MKRDQIVWLARVVIKEMHNKDITDGLCGEWSLWHWLQSLLLPSSVLLSRLLTYIIFHLDNLY